MDQKTIAKQHRILFVFAYWIAAGLLATATTCLGAADSATVGNMEQIEITVIHVDQFAVYGPNRIFYFDTRMDKRKTASMMKTADHLRNRKATITYSSSGDPAQDKHVFLMDIVPVGERPTMERPSVPTREARESVSGTQDKTAKTPSGEGVAAPPDVTAETRDASRQAQTRDKTLSPQPRTEARAPAGMPEDKPARTAPGAGLAPPANDPVELRVPSKQALPREKAQPPGQRLEARAPAGTPEDKPPRTAPGTGVAPPANDPVELRVPPRQALPQEKAQPPGQRLEARAPAGTPEDKPPRTAEPSQSITKQEITSFVRNILDLNGKKDLSGVLPFYAEKVDYYDRGVVGRDYVRRDLGYYFQNWDSISTSLDGDVVMIVLDRPEERTAKFISRFSVRNEKKSVAGRTENIWRIQRINGQLRLIGVKQRIISRDQ